MAGTAAAGDLREVMTGRLAASAAIAFACAIVLNACGGSGPTTPPIVTPPNGGGTTNPPPVQPPTLGVTKIMAFGDSLTEGESLGQLLGPSLHDPGTAGVSTSYPAKLQGILTSTYTAQTIRVFNAGRGGEFAVGSQALARLGQMLTTYQPEVVLLLHGVNNVNAGDNLLTIAEAVEEMIELANARGVRHVFLGNLPDQIPTTKATGAARITPFNQLLPAIAEEEGATLVDVRSAINTQTMLMPDGLHLNEAGNVKLAETFYAALRARYHQNPQ